VKVVVLGAGVVGTAAAWFLSKNGHDVTVVEREPAAGLETSFANGGQVSPCHAEPWANPGTPLRVPSFHAFQIDASGEMEVTGASITTPPEVRIVNPEHHIAQLSAKSAKLRALPVPTFSSAKLAPT